MRDAWPAFAALIESERASLPRFVRDELEGFASCGDFARGYVIAQCSQCGDSLRVPFSCKSRGICPSCMGRRMGESAALLIDHRLPAVPWRRWVLSFQGPMAVRLGYDTQLLTLVCRRFAKHVMQTLRRATKHAHRLRSGGDLHAGVLIVVQRFRSDLGLYVHVHALVPDGCFAADGLSVQFFPVRDLGPTHLIRVLDRLARDLDAASHDDDPPDEGLAACIHLGASRTRMRGTLVDDDAPPPSSMLVSAHDMTLHATVTVDGRDRRRLERLCRYLFRPAFAHDAVRRTDDGQVRVHFKAPSKSGATYAQMTPHTFVARLCALMPPPRFHMARYYGVLAPLHALCERIRPTTPWPATPRQLALLLPANGCAAARELPAHRGPLHDAQLRDRPPSRISWLKLLARVFRIDLICIHCNVPLKIAQVVAAPDLHGEPYRPRGPPAGKVVSPQQLSLALMPA